MLCNKIDKPLMVYRFSGNVKTAIITLCKTRENQKCNFKYFNVMG